MTKLLSTQTPLEETLEAVVSFGWQHRAAGNYQASREIKPHAC